MAAAVPPLADKTDSAALAAWLRALNPDFAPYSTAAQTGGVTGNVLVSAPLEASFAALGMRNPDHRDQLRNALAQLRTQEEEAREAVAEGADGEGGTTTTTPVGDTVGISTAGAVDEHSTATVAAPRTPEGKSPIEPEASTSTSSLAKGSGGDAVAAGAVVPAVSAPWRSPNPLGEALRTTSFFSRMSESNDALEQARAAARAKPNPNPSPNRNADGALPATVAEEADDAQDSTPASAGVVGATASATEAARQCESESSVCVEAAEAGAELTTGAAAKGTGTEMDAALSPLASATGGNASMPTESESQKSVAGRAVASDEAPRRRVSIRALVASGMRTEDGAVSAMLQAPANTASWAVLHEGFLMRARKGFSLTRAKQQYCLLKQHPREARAVLEFYAGVVLAETQDVLSTSTVLPTKVNGVFDLVLSDGDVQSFSVERRHPEYAGSWVLVLQQVVLALRDGAILQAGLEQMADMSLSGVRNLVSSDERYGAPNVGFVDSPETRKDSATRTAQREGLLRTAFMTDLATRYTFINGPDTSQ